jgi:hypothetical protein
MTPVPIENWANWNTILGRASFSLTQHSIAATPTHLMLQSWSHLSDMIIMCTGIYKYKLSMVLMCLLHTYYILNIVPMCNYKA